MNRFREHCGGREPVTVEFNTVEELLAIPCVAWWEKHAPLPVRYLRSRHDGTPATSRDGLSWDGYLIVEYDHDGKHGVLGYLQDTMAVDLPDHQDK